MTGILSFDVLYDLNCNLITIKQRDQFDVKVVLVCGADWLAGDCWSSAVPKNEIQTLNGVLRIGKTSFEIKHDVSQVAYIDLHTTRNLYITSSSLASCSIVSKLWRDHSTKLP